MFFRIEHETRYQFSAPVFLEPHLLRLTPRSDVAQEVDSFTLSIVPPPQGQCEIIDASGNAATWAWFAGTTTELLLTTSSTVRTVCANPFGYLLAPEALTLPIGLPPLEHESLAPFLVAEDHEAGRELMRQLALATDNDTIAFLTALNSWIYGNITISARWDAGVQTPQETLASRQGACRDVAVLFMRVCRLAGIPARYVSGYQSGDPEQVLRDLHAYAEVYLPGAGWRGYDPTLGLAVADDHVAICAAHTPELTAPVTGGYRGDARSTLTHQISLEIITQCA